MNTTTYNDGLKPGGRRPRLFLAKGTEEIVEFRGVHIPGWCVVSAETYQKNGKWSNTDYTLLLAPGVRPLYFLSPLHGTWGDGLGSWEAVASKIELSVAAAKRLVAGVYPSTAKRLSEVEAFVTDNQ